MLVPIGRFSQMTRLSIKALRLYDEIGLLTPTEVDPSSGYRYYSPSQANHAEAIRILRSVEMPLDEIAELLAADDADDVRRALKRHRDLLVERPAEQQRMLTYLETLIEREDIMPYHVEIETTDDRYVAALNMRTTMARIGDDIGRGFGTLVESVGMSAVVGPPFIVYHDIIDDETDGDIELCMPVTPGTASSAEVVTRIVHGGLVAATTHHGPYHEVGPAYHTLAGWISDHGHEMAGPPREIYLNDPRTVPETDLLTKIEWPIDQAGNPT